MVFFFVSFQTSLSTSQYNVIDECWRSDPNWEHNRMKLADCAAGFGSRANGGKGGRIYTVTSSDDNPANPEPGTLRHASTLRGAVWIIFARDMQIQLKLPLFVSSHTTIDGRGASVTISNGACIRVSNVRHIIIHGLTIHDCWESSPGHVLISKARGVVNIYQQDGDAISIESSRDVWIDHNTLSHCADGLVDVTLGSAAITVSNNRFFSHNEVMLLGNSDSDLVDKHMRVTVAFNHFGPGLMQRMPRARLGYVHVVNNYYEPWGIYAIGGTSNPTILSQANVFVAPDDYTKKQVTQHKDNSYSSSVWRSKRDLFLKGAYFEQSGEGKKIPMYRRGERFRVEKAKFVPVLTKDAGALLCVRNRPC
ncbi:hypothetical protein SUGI_0566130 [Cryptomeria japonica]|uniref:pectate lyase 1-like n=1 Tax=Cryptomeria japonica TaxID=3369 RepID=UPI002408A964|nr:pectate lyase 1-like [Cryptomeria japonica]GLJ28726.1 hypothetical protein SUGI_0566130 [Cryptomeria japonica]